MNVRTFLLTTHLGIALGLAGTARTAEILVSKDIKVSTTWTSNNTYNLQKQIYVLPGATLTIQAGTVVASTTNLGGSLAVTRGAQIFVLGTETKPVIFTSKADVATWTNGDPRTGKWRETANEWGNLTLMGRGYVSSCVPGNKPYPAATNHAVMEGLVASKPGDPNVLFGGGNDDDDSGTLQYVSFRYGGKVIGLGNELNGLSLGGIGRGTDIHHVEIMNNVDDGIEIWGGTVNLKYVSIWNVGDDCFDLDMGWRGKAQFGLLVQGYSLNAKQGSGVGDNCFETDGAEGSDFQPVTTAAIYNFTVVGQPFDGDQATAWRDNARVQYHNCIFMDIGDEIVKFDNKGDHNCGALGYGANGTLSWVQTWKTPYNKVPKHANDPANRAQFYKAQISGFLAEIRDSVFYHNKGSKAYTEASNIGGSGLNIFTAPGYNNIKEPANSPITKLTRGTAVVKGGKVMVPVTFLDPRPANDALYSVTMAPADGFFTPAKFRGAFAPGDNWLYGWTSSTAFGFAPTARWGDVGNGLGGLNGAPVLMGQGTVAPSSPVTFSLINAKPNSVAVFTFGSKRLDLPVFGGLLVPDITSGGGFIAKSTDGSGKAKFTATWPAYVPSNLALYFQSWVVDSAGPQGVSASNAIFALF